MIGEFGHKSRRARGDWWSGSGAGLFCRFQSAPTCGGRQDMNIFANEQWLFQSTPRQSAASTPREEIFFAVADIFGDRGAALGRIPFLFVQSGPFFQAGGLGKQGVARAQPVI